MQFRNVLADLLCKHVEFLSLGLQQSLKLGISIQRALWCGKVEEQAVEGHMEHLPAVVPHCMTI